MAESCLFCRIARGEIAAKVAFQDDRVVAFHDVNPQAPTHVLVIPRQHIPSADAMGPEHGALLVAMLQAAQRLAREVGAERSGYRLVLNHGRDGGQSVDHVHLHFLAGRKLGWPPG